jgi:hypothetical protein
MPVGWYESDAARSRGPRSSARVHHGARSPRRAFTTARPMRAIPNVPRGLVRVRITGVEALGRRGTTVTTTLRG